MKETIKRILAGVFVFCVVAGSMEIPSYAGEKPKGFSKVSENEYLSLYINEEDANIAVYDKASGNYWYTSPVDADADTFASGYYKRLLKASVVVQFFNEKVQSQTMDSYNDSVMNGTFVIKEEENGVTVEYSLGKAAANLTIPEVISYERLEIFKAKMEAGELKKINRNYTLIEWEKLSADDKASYLESYPGYENIPFYVLRGGVKDYLKEEMAGYFERAGYTMEELEADLIASGSIDGESTDPWFEIPVEFKLDGPSLDVSVDFEKFSYNDEGFYLTGISVLPYFGATTGEEGYIFVPDGSGALINFDNGKTSVPSYTASVYGSDLSQQVLSITKSEMDEAYSVKMPVYGIKKEDGALFAVIEGADALATINADISGRTSSYNNVYPSFSYLQYGPVSLGDMIGSNNYQLYSAEGPSENIAIRYMFLDKEHADYSGMAAYYRDYLIENEVLKERVTDENIPFALELIGAIDKYKSFLGVKYSAIEPLTTFKEALNIVNTLNEGGVENIKVVYDGWAKGGLRGNANTKLKVLNKLQRGLKLQKFVDACVETGNDVYLTTDSQYVYVDKAFDGYTEFTMAPNYFDHTRVKVYEYGLSDNKNNGDLAKLISPYFAGEVIGKIGTSIGRVKGAKANINTTSNTLYSDYLEKHYTDRAKAKSLYEEALDNLRGTGNCVLSDNSNVYAIKYSDGIINAPLFSNKLRIVDEEVPFYEMVIHGYISYTGEAINQANDYRTTLLKSIESGAGIHYEWIAKDNSVLKETDYDDFYAVSYTPWIESAINEYRMLNEKLAGLNSQVIVKHEIKTSEVRALTYEDGTMVYINYGSEETVCDGVRIAGRDISVVKGMGK